MTSDGEIVVRTATTGPATAMRSTIAAIGKTGLGRDRAIA
jgi:hypothetical protein